jgi:hypothetical protein
MTLADRTRLYLVMAHCGALGAIGVVLAFGLALPEFVKGLSIGVMIAPLAAMLARRLRDEYLEELWRSGTSLAFVAMVLMFLVMPFCEGVYDGFTGNGSGQDIPAEAAGLGAIIAFYAGFHIRWLRDLR